MWSEKEREAEKNGCQQAWCAGAKQQNASPALNMNVPVLPFSHLHLISDRGGSSLQVILLTNTERTGSPVLPSDCTPS